ncbi:sensor histidine kinase [Jannaschia sp. Os4]|uniref:sensor histidine kinase n=1 Tax=Jannaschia sp. Os4 TaxID=2807617 RepID=UPI00193A0794|nr:ATP-binding protein [Jannaschia sp. Os4]MBM2576836.1 sensor histidine kinase [Jannaschia sp. Os4]
MFWHDESARVEVPEEGGRLSWFTRAILISLGLVALGALWFANGALTSRFVAATEERAQLRQSLYSGAILSELQRNSVVPLLLARDTSLIAALRARDFSASSQRLISYVDEIGAASIVLADAEGRVVAATDRNELGSVRADAPAFTDALERTGTVFTLAQQPTGAYRAAFSRTVRDGNDVLGVLEVQVDLAQFESRWRGTSAAVVVTDAAGIVILSTEPRWRGQPLEEALAGLSVPTALQRALASAGGYGPDFEEEYFSGDALMKLEGRIPFRGWSLVSFTSYDSVRQQVNGVLALILTGFALAIALGFYLLNRRNTLQTLLARRESAKLRALNARLSAEVAERKRVQEELKETEQSLAQSSKLAALGEMSAAVSHELNQPLAAMRTYLAGAKLLLQRRRSEEALSSFQRIDDLIERMGAITRQLKSYARKGGEAFEPVDVRHALKSALTLMEPQLRRDDVRISQLMPEEPVMVMADRLRLEQVIINLVRNALDAMKGMERRDLDLLVTQGDEAVLAVRDTGHGIDAPDKLFEPFFTTKKPGEGVGLGLAISSGIVTDLGGRLLARNAEAGGAVFEVRLPVYVPSQAAAE